MKCSTVLAMAVFGIMCGYTSRHAAAGNLFAAEGSGIYEYTSGGSRSTFTNYGGYTPAIAFDASSNLYFTDINLGVGEITPSGSTSVFASELNFPGALAFDASGNLYSGGGFGDIFKITPGGSVSEFADLFYDGSGASIVGLACDGSDLFASFWGGGGAGEGYIIKITPGGIQSTFASGLTNPSGMACNSSGDVFEADYGSGNIYEFTPTGQQSTFAGGLDYPNSLAMDASGNLFVTTFGGIYEVTSGGSLSLFTSDTASALAFAPDVPEPAIWAASGGGSWAAAGNWANGIIPQNAGDAANFTSTVTTGSTITLDGNWTVGNVNFNNANSYTIAPGSGGNLTLDNGSSTAGITDSLGTHFISANLVLNSNTVITVANATDSLNISGNISGSGGLTIAGAGKVALSGSSNAISSLAIDSGSTLDLTSSSLLIQFGSNPDPIATIQSYLSSGYDGGTWSGTGLTSSIAASSSGKFAIGYLDGADGGGTAGQLLLQYALVGDANLDGTVNLTDLLALLNNYGETGRDWAAGDFNYDSTVNLTDLLALLNNYGSTALTTGGESAAGSSFNSMQVVPEPASVGFLAIAAVGLLGRRRSTAIR